MLKRGACDRASPVRGRGLVLALLVGLLGLLTGACGNPAQSSEPGPAAKGPSAATQTNEAGQVKVAVTWQGPASPLAFTIALDTHSVDLDDSDLSQLAVLRTDQGQELRPTSWDAPKGGHHRAGTLTFSPTSADGRPALGSTTRGLELIIRDLVGVPERSFRWEL
jgi:hypothetical protein